MTSWDSNTGGARPFVSGLCVCRLQLQLNAAWSALPHCEPNKETCSSMHVWSVNELVV